MAFQMIRLLNNLNWAQTDINHITREVSRLRSPAGRAVARRCPVCCMPVDRSVNKTHQNQARSASLSTSADTQTPTCNSQYFSTPRHQQTQGTHQNQPRSALPGTSVYIIIISRLLQLLKIPWHAHRQWQTATGHKHACTHTHTHTQLLNDLLSRDYLSELVPEETFTPSHPWGNEEGEGFAQMTRSTVWKLIPFIVLWKRELLDPIKPAYK